MWLLATDVAWSVCVSVSLLDTTVNPAKMAELIKMLLGLWTWVGPRCHALGGNPNPLQGKGQF